jgi:hypothetical protein
MPNSDIEIDNNSSGSVGSRRGQKVPCHYCNNDFQTRSLFNHIRTKHAADFALSLTNIIKKLKDIDDPFIVDHHFTNEQDEPQIIPMYACLASNKIFLEVNGWNKHFKKNPSLFKKHCAEVKKLKQNIKEANINYFQIASKTKDKALARAFYRRSLYLLPKISDIINIIGSRDNEKENWNKEISNNLPLRLQRSYIPFERMRASFIFTKKQVEDAVKSQTLQFDSARKYWEDLEAIIDSVQDHYDCGHYASPIGESNKYGIINSLHVEPPHFGVSHPSYPEIDF